MFNSTFTINEEILNNNSNTLKEQLWNLGVKEEYSELVDKLKNNNNWYENYEESFLKKIVLAFSEVDNCLVIEIEEWEDLKFEYGDLIKKLFFLHISSVWEYKPSVNNVVNILFSVQKSEEKYNKCVVNFTKEEIEKSIIDLMEGMQYYRLRQRINVISRLQNYYSEDIEIHSNWKDSLSPSELEKIIGRDTDSSDLIDLEDLISLFKSMNNMQDSIIPILIFSGVKLSRSNEKDEIRYIKKTDLYENFLTIRGRDGNKDRVIELESEIAKMIRETAMQNYAIKEKRGKPVVLELKDTAYILRPALPARSKNTDEDEDVLSFRGAWGRLLFCREQMEALAPEFSFSSKKIEQSGKIYYINKFIEEKGMDLYDAIRATLKRFGDWRYLDMGNEKSYAPNTQMVNRLKHLWSVYN